MFRKKKEAAVVEIKPAYDAMWEACEALKRTDLYPHLKYVILADPRGEEVDRLTTKGTWPHYEMMGNVALQRGKLGEAKEYFEKAAELIAKDGRESTGSHITPIVANWDVAAMIAGDYWNRLRK